MSGVVDFAEAKRARMPHVSGALYCTACGHGWDAVWPAGTTQFECPECKAMRGRSKFDVMPQEGQPVFTCNSCENQLFTLLPDRVHCPGCGNQWDYGTFAPGTPPAPPAA